MAWRGVAWRDMACWPASLGRSTWTWALLNRFSQGRQGRSQLLWLAWSCLRVTIRLCCVEWESGKVKDSIVLNCNVENAIDFLSSLGAEVEIMPT